MKQHLTRYALGFLLLLILLGHSARLYQIPLINHFDAIGYDAKLRLTMPKTQDDRIVILDIDEKSLAELGRWPWSRDKLAQLLDRLFDQYKIAVLGFDVVFAEPDDSSGVKSLEALAQHELKDDGTFQSLLRDLRPKLDYDSRFAESMKQRPVVLGFYFTSKGDEAVSSGALPVPVFPSGTFQGRKIEFTNWNGFGRNLDAFQKSAATAGHFNPWVYFDGTSRRVPLIAEYKGAYYEALSLAMVRQLLGSPKIVPG